MDDLQSEINTVKSTLSERESDIGRLEGEKRDLHGTVVRLNATLQEKESEVERFAEENTELWKGVGLHRKNMVCLQPVVSKLSTAVGGLELERHRLTMALAEQDREVERLKKEKKELQEAMEARHSSTPLSPEVAKLSETLSKWDSSLQELMCNIKVSCITGNRHSLATCTKPFTVSIIRANEFLIVCTLAYVCNFSFFLWHHSNSHRAMEQPLCVLNS